MGTKLGVTDRGGRTGNTRRLKSVRPMASWAGAGVSATNGTKAPQKQIVSRGRSVQFAQAVRDWLGFIKIFELI